MRSAQQNRDIRRRGNNNNRTGTCKAPDPLSLNYESNGPDVKIRGSAQHVAEAYRILARDAQASGDRVTAENYRQHADHYRRIIMAAMLRQNNPHRCEESPESDGSDGDEGGVFPPAPLHPYGNGAGPQPAAEGKTGASGFSEQSSGRDGGDQRRSGRGGRRRRGRVRGDEKSEQPVAEAAVVTTAGAQSAGAEEPARRAAVTASAPEASMLSLAGQVLSNS